MVRVTGTLDGVGEGSFADQVIEFVTEDHAKLVFNLSALESIDSSGLSSLVNLATRARMRGGDFALAAPGTFVSGVLSITRHDSWLSVFETVGGARAVLQGS